MCLYAPSRCDLDFVPLVEKFMLLYSSNNLFMAHVVDTIDGHGLSNEKHRELQQCNED